MCCASGVGTRFVDASGPVFDGPAATIFLKSSIASVIKYPAQSSIFAHLLFPEYQLITLTRSRIPAMIFNQPPKEFAP